MERYTRDAEQDDAIGRTSEEGYKHQEIAKMLKISEGTSKSQYARDIDHLVTFNQNGLWIKEPIKDGNRIISAVSISGPKIKNTKMLKSLPNDYSKGLTINITDSYQQTSSSSKLLHLRDYRL